MGHYVGSLASRLKLQNDCEMFLLVADLHALTTNQDTSKMKENIKDLVLDQLSVGIDPEKATFCVQSRIPEDQELFTIFSMLVSKNRLERIPTLKEVMRDLKIKNASLGLLSYPVLQAADILMVRANLVPVGKDQISHLELAREIAKEFNLRYGEVFPIPESLTPSKIGVLPGIDGKAKMSKSLDNAIYLSDDESTVTKKVMQMYTDPSRIHPTDLGHVEGNPVFTYLDVFGGEKAQKEVSHLKERYKKGAVGDVEVKKFLAKVLNGFLDPIRKKRSEYESKKGLVEKILSEGTEKTRKEAKRTFRLAKKAMNLF